MVRRLSVIGAVCAALLVALPTVAALEGSHIVLELGDRSDIEQLTQLVSIDRIEGGRVWAQATPRQLEHLRALGFSWQVDWASAETADVRMGLGPSPSDTDWTAYPTWADYVALMEELAAVHPDLCLLHDLGPTTNLVRPHRLLVLEISDNPGVEEDEPEVLFTSTMHGDETVGYVLLLRLADELLRRYDPASDDPRDQQATRLVDELSIWVNPLANPDGTYMLSDGTVAGATRYLANPDGTSSGVDPNRNFPSPLGDDHPDGNPSWLETSTMMAFAEAHRFVLSANFHGGAEVVNYPWDTWPYLHTDDRWFHRLARSYADRVHLVAAAPPWNDPEYMTDLDDGITNGWAWYPVFGGRQDYMVFFHGCRETTIELSHAKTPPAAHLPFYWETHRAALLTYLETALGGVRGVVTDQDGVPLSATVGVAWHDVQADRPWVETDPDVGDYHRLLPAGRYWLVFSADGYLSSTREVAVGSRSAARSDVVLEPDHGIGTALVGRVVLATTGEPVAGATVRLLAPAVAEATTAGDGGFVFPSLSEGAALLEVTAVDRALARVGVDIRAPQTTIEVALHRQTAVSGARSEPRAPDGGRLGG